MNHAETKTSIPQSHLSAEHDVGFKCGAKVEEEQVKMAVVVCGFPGVGKTSLFFAENELTILDSDSTNFSWSDETKTQRNPEWPQNYIAHIQDAKDSSDLVLVSSHDVVRTALAEAGIPFILVYPSLDMKAEYIQRYIQRGSNESFIALLEANYEKWITELMAQQGCTHMVLQSGQYLSDILNQLL